MLQVYTPIEEIENDEELLNGMIEEYRILCNESSDANMEDLLKGNYFPEEELIYDTESGVWWNANEYAHNLLKERGLIK